MNSRDSNPRYSELSTEEYLQWWYKNYYAENSYGRFSTFFQNWIHKSLEKSFHPNEHIPIVLEIGANEGEHIRYVKHQYNRYIASDLFKPQKFEIEDKKIEFQVIDVMKIPLPSKSVDRVICTCVLHHVLRPEVACKEIRRVMKNYGKATIFLPHDPGLFYRIAKRIGPVNSAKKKGLFESKLIVDALDHRNHYKSLERIIKTVFSEDSINIKYFPTPIKSWNLGLFSIITITKLEINE